MERCLETSKNRRKKIRKGDVVLVKVSYNRTPLYEILKIKDVEYKTKNGIKDKYFIISIIWSNERKHLIGDTQTGQFRKGTKIEYIILNKKERFNLFPYIL